MLVSRSSTRRRKLASVVSVSSLMLIAACSSSSTPATTSAASAAGGASSTSAAPSDSNAPGVASTETVAPNTKANPNAVHIKVWAWYPEFKSVVETFNATHPDIQVDWTNVGAGGDDYAKLKTAMKAGSGAPDVAMIEFQELPTFEILNSLVDMGQYGANDDKALYADWAWKQATDGSKVYAIPVDGGPMALMYRKDLFDQYKIPVPKTWAEYQDAAVKIKAAQPGSFIASMGSDGGWLSGLLWQGGCKPYSYSLSAAKTSVGVKLTDPNCKKVIDYYGNMVTKGLMDKAPFFTADASAALDSGKYWTWAAAGWTPGYLAGSLKKSSGKWGVAPMPQWTAGANDQGDWGGSTFTVTTQSTHPKEATIVARELYGKSDAAWDIGVNKAFLYPLSKKVASSAAFTGKGYDFFGGQKVNEVIVPASDGLGDFQWTPFQDFVFTTLLASQNEAMTGKRQWNTVLDDTQQKVLDYAKQQGFTVN